MAGFPDDRPAARVPPDAIVRRMRPRVRLIADDPQDLAAGLRENLALLRDGRGVDPVFGVAHALAARARGGQNAVATGQGLAEHGLLGKSVASELLPSGTRRPVISRKRLFDDDVLAALEGFDGQRLVRRSRPTNVDYVCGVAQLLERLEGPKAALARKSLARLGRFRGHADHLDRNAVDAPVSFPVKTRRKSRTNYADAKLISHSRRQCRSAPSVHQHRFGFGYNRSSFFDHVSIFHVVDYLLDLMLSNDYSGMIFNLSVNVQN